MGDLSSEANRYLEKLSDLEGSQAILNTRKNYFEYLVNYINNSNSLEQAILPSTVGINDPILSNLVSRMIDLQLEVKSRKDGVENPLVRDMYGRLEDVKLRILEAINNLQETDEINLNQLGKEINLIDNELRSLPNAERKLISIERNFTLNENLFIFLMQKRAEAGITKASTTSDIEVVNPPRVAGGPVYPNTSRNYMLAILLGLGLPLGILILQERLNTKIQSKEDLTSITNIPVIGGIGHITAQNNLVVQQKPKVGSGRGISFS